jgi:hypothetical protein
MKTILGALAAIMLLGVVATQPAEAACFAGPYGWHCWHPHPHWYWRHPGWDRW